MDETELKSAVKYEIERAEGYIQDDVKPRPPEGVRSLPG